MKDFRLRKVGEARTPAEWAQLHAGIDFIMPDRDREMMQLKAMGATVEQLSSRFGMAALEVDRAIARTARTLATWERNACKWSTRFVACEPMAETGAGWRPGDSNAPVMP
jgi:hypothetical protein